MRGYCCFGNIVYFHTAYLYESEYGGFVFLLYVGEVFVQGLLHFARAETDCFLGDQYDNQHNSGKADEKNTEIIICFFAF